MLETRIDKQKLSLRVQREERESYGEIFIMGKTTNTEKLKDYPSDFENSEISSYFLTLGLYTNKNDRGIKYIFYEKRSIL